MNNLSQFYFLWGCLLSGLCGSSLLHLAIKNSQTLQLPIIIVLFAAKAVAAFLWLEKDLRIWSIVIGISLLGGCLVWI
ncbi:hypothetical protein ACP6PL_10360 [Dapis sp. BLCC M126]|uniref:hypothetical protein n=1 Tax=Dapis sp. BLCC M126 TaxID=3400189 RepID=UPI003CED17EF